MLVFRPDGVLEAWLFLLTQDQDQEQDLERVRVMPALEGFRVHPASGLDGRTRLRFPDAVQRRDTTRRAGGGPQEAAGLRLGIRAAGMAGGPGASGTWRS